MKKSHRLTLHNASTSHKGTLELCDLGKSPPPSQGHSTARNGSCCGSFCAPNSCMDSLESCKSWTPPKSLLTECTNHISQPFSPHSSPQAPLSIQPEGQKLQHLGWHSAAGPRAAGGCFHKQKPFLPSSRAGYSVLLVCSQVSCCTCPVLV